MCGHHLSLSFCLIFTDQPVTIILIELYGFLREKMQGRETVSCLTLWTLLFKINSKRKGLGSLILKSAEI
jgi:hypothetical protein